MTKDKKRVPHSSRAFGERVGILMCFNEAGLHPTEDRRYQKVPLPGVPYNFPRKFFTTCRIAFSFRRYQRHCPCLVASTNPAFVRIAI